MSTLRACLSALPALCLLTACSPHTVTENPDAPLVLPEAWSEGGERKAQAPQPERWWEEFQDPRLNELVDQSLHGNFDINAAWARLSQANALADQAGAGFWPTLDLTLGASHDHQPGSTFQTNGMTINRDAQNINAVTGSIAAGYEVDLWKKISSGARAAALDREAVADNVQALAMSVAAEVAEAWFDVVAVRERREILEAQFEINERFLELERVRFGQGLSSVLDVNQQEQLVARSSAQLALTVSREEVSLHRLALLLGQTPGSVLSHGAPEDLPPLPPLPSSGIPSELLQRRPDVRAAQRKVEAADYRVAVAVAERYPSLRLTASIGTRPNSFNSWAFDPLWNLAAGLAQPIFQGGRLKAEVAKQRAVMGERVADFGKTLLKAMVEVENALVQERQQLVHMQDLSKQYKLSEVALREARNRYSQGLVDFLRVLTTLRSLQDQQLQLLDARRQLLSYRIQLCRALGGTWAEELKAPSQDEGDEQEEENS